MVKVKILEQNLDFLIKEIRYKKSYFSRKFRDKIEIIAYFNGNGKNMESEINGE